MNLIGPDGKGVREIAEAACIEDKDQFETLLPRLYEPVEHSNNIKEFHDISDCPPKKLPENPEDSEEIIFEGSPLRPLRIKN
ncbi:MAG: hypothetical protein ACOC1O_05945 [bacterium]